MTTVIAFANQKGGVGKTTIAVQFAYFLKLKKKKKVLFIDMDAQGNASSTLMGEEEMTTKTTSLNLFDDELAEGMDVQQTPYGIDLIGSVQSPEAYDVEALPLEQALNPKKWLEPILGNYDYVLIDCPPSLGRRLIGSLHFSDYVVCPIKLSGYAIAGLTGLFATIKEVQNSINSNLKVLGIPVNEYLGTATQRDELEALKDALPDTLFEARIQTRSPIDASSRGLPVWRVRNGQRAAEELHALFREMLKRMRND